MYRTINFHAGMHACEFKQRMEELSVLWSGLANAVYLLESLH